MIFASVYKIPVFLLERLHTLFCLLRERKTEYEAFAEKVEDKQLKRTVLTLAQETNQYAVELSSQIQTLGGNMQTDECTDHIINPDKIMVSGETDILKSCELSEQKMIAAYRTVLNEPFLHENLRKLIRTQLNGLTSAFLQLKLLNTSYHR
jgi:uncharacterized protein (TIGR02284 family)